MADIITPQLGESVSEATVARWTKKPGDPVRKDETLVELETDKVGLEVGAPADGVMGEITAAEGATVTPGAKLGTVSDTGGQPSPQPETGAPSRAKTAADAPGLQDAPATAAAPDAEAQPEPVKGEPAPTPSAPAPAANAYPDEDSNQAATPPTAQPAPAPAAAATSGQGAMELKAPSMGESVSEGTVARWTKVVGDTVKKDEVLVEIETDKVAVEVASPADGVLAEIAAAEGASVKPGDVMGRVTGGAGAGAAAPTIQPAAAAQPAKAEQPAPAEPQQSAKPLSPAVRRIVDEGRLDPMSISGSGKDGRITKGDALAAQAAQAAQSAQPQARPAQAPAPSQTPAAQPAPAQPQSMPAAPRQDGPREERVRMSRLRQTIARRLKEAQNTAAMLTTFNEVDMTNVMALRTKYKDGFEKRHGVKLGFMGFFVKATVAALQEIPAVNAEIDGTDIVYRNRWDIGVAVGTDRGLVVPVVRDADQLSLSGIEKAIGALGKKARDNALAIEDMQGGTFTVSNGGVYGSLMSTPILNPPQSGVLGLHKIQERPVVLDGQIVIRPMMYLALSYDHRIVDGKEAVTFLVRIKETVEDPERLLLEV